MKTSSLPRLPRMAQLGLLVFLAALLLVNTVPTAARATGRVLLDTEMAAIFGDGPDGAADLPCFKAGNCNVQYLYGTDQCAKCDYNYARDVCCNLGTKNDCKPNGGSATCGGDLLVGKKSGTLGTCFECASPQLDKMGTCNNFYNATGTKCPK